MGRRNFMKLCREPVAALGDRLYIVCRLCRAVAKYGPQLANSAIDGMIEVDDLAGWPELSAKVLSRDHIPAAFDQNGKQPGDLVGNT
jgi:hypothetical protein